MVKLAKLFLFSLVIAVSGCGDDDLWKKASTVIEESLFGSDSSYEYNADHPVVGVYRGYSSIFFSDTNLAFYEFADDYDTYGDGETATCYAYFTHLNIVLEMPYRYDAASDTITFDTVTRYSAFESDVVINTSFLEGVINPFTGVSVNSEGLSADYIYYSGGESSSDNSVKIELTRSSGYFPSSQQECSTKMLLNINNPSLANMVVLAIGSTDMFSMGNDSADTPTNCGLGIARMDAEGKGTVVLVVPDDLFSSSTTVTTIVTFGDIPDNDHWDFRQGYPFTTYQGYSDENWGGGAGTIPVEFELTMGEIIDIAGSTVVLVDEMSYE